MRQKSNHSTTPMRFILLEKAIKEAAQIGHDDLIAKSRIASHVDARSAIWHIAHTYLEMSYKHIARLYNRDHSTIMYAAKRFAKKEVARSVVRKLKKSHPNIFKVADDEHIEAKNWRFKKTL